MDHQAISGTAAAAQITAQTTFNAEAINIPNVTITQCVPPRVTDSTTGRTAVVNYTATKNNLFMGIFGYPVDDDHRLVDGASRPVDEYQFLSAARQFAVDEHRGDDGGHHRHGRQHLGAGRLRLRLPRIQSVRG